MSESSNLRPVKLLAALAAAAALSACGPSIDAAAKADIDRQIASLQPAGTSIPAPSAGEFTPMPLRPGQWIKLKMIDDEGQPSFLTYKVLSEEGGAFWIEVVNASYIGKSVQKMLVFFGSRTDPKQLEIRQVAMKDAKGNVQEPPKEMMAMMQPIYRSALSALIIEWEGKPQENAQAPAGNFAGCYKVRSKAQWGPWKSEAESWSHPKVPINGLVRCKGIDKKFEMELIAYGETGATSEY